MVLVHCGAEGGITLKGQGLNLIFKGQLCHFFVIFMSTFIVLQKGGNIFTGSAGRGGDRSEIFHSKDFLDLHALLGPPVKT